MKVHVADIAIPSEELMLDIVHALENAPPSGASYEIEMKDGLAYDLDRNRPTDNKEWRLRIFKQVSV